MQRIPIDLRSWVVVVLVAGGAALSGCASSGQGKASSGSCGLRDRDSSLTAGSALYRDCSVDHPAKLLTTDIRPDIRDSRPTNGCKFVDLEFVVDTLGRPEVGMARVARTNDQNFADAWMATLQRWKYEPATRHGEKVRQVVTEHKVAQAFSVLVPAGSPPPSSPPANAPRPTC